jgi:hypothetical protein
MARQSLGRPGELVGRGGSVGQELNGHAGRTTGVTQRQLAASWRETIDLHPLGAAANVRLLRGDRSAVLQSPQHARQATLDRFELGPDALLGEGLYVVPGVTGARVPEQMDQHALGETQRAGADRKGGFSCRLGRPHGGHGRRRRGHALRSVRRGDRRRVRIGSGGTFGRRRRSTAPLPLAEAPTQEGVRHAREEAPAPDARQELPSRQRGRHPRWSA